MCLGHDRVWMEIWVGMDGKEAEASGAPSAQESTREEAESKL